MSDETNEFMRTLLDATDDAMSLLAADGTFLYVNSAMAAKVGRPRDELLGMCAFDLFSPEVAEHRRRILDEALRSGTPARYVDQDGDRYYEVRVFPRAGRAAFYFHDISEARLREQRHREHEEIFRAVTESAVDAIFCKDLDRRYTLANPAMERLLNLPAAEIMGKSAEDIFGPEAVAAIEEADGPAFAGKPNTGFWTIDVGDNRHTFHVVEVPLLDTDGSVSGICGIVRDISELKESERALQEKEFLVESASSVIATTSLDGVMTYANPAFLATWGFDSLDEVLGNPFSRFWMVEHVLDEIMASLLGEGKWTGEIEARRKDGSLFDVQVQAAAIRDNEGELVGLMSSSIDITERKEAEKALARRAEELGRSNTELEQFAYVASHDLQEPLRMVSSYVQLLERRYKDRLDDNANDFIGFASDGAKRMQAMIIDLLALSRVSTAAQPFVPIQTEEVFDRAVTYLEILIDERGAVVERGPLPRVEVDPIQFTQLFQNLLSNAVKFCPRQPRVDVTAEQVDGEWIFSVQDNGVGIAAEDHERVFVIFNSLHNRQEHGGNGIGLAIAKRIVERHGGRIWVESEEGKGATFYFSVPAER